MTDVRVAVLDDYWRMTEKAVDWSSLDGASVDFFYVDRPGSDYRTIEIV